MESWEDREDEKAQQAAPAKQGNAGGFSFNPNASSFNFNPTASSFTPSFTPAAAAPAAAPAEPASSPAPAVEEPTQPAAEAEPEPAAEPVAEPVAAEEPATPPAEEALDEVNQPPAEAAAPPGSPAAAPAPAAPSSPGEAAAKEVKRVTLSGDDGAVETEEQKAARIEEAKKTLEEINKEDPREHLNIVFIGHVDAGKSTTAGQILFLTGGVDDRTIEKYEREAKEKNRESWYMAYIMDTNEEERAKGKTVEVGRAYFETPKKRYTILDAPGHKNYVPNMITGASQADVGVLVISARKGEFETGYERGGQTREHAQLAKTLGVTKLVVVVNKMDEPSIVGPNGEWPKDRYDEIEGKLTPFLRTCGYNPKKDLVFLPISGLLGDNLKTRVDSKKCDWYKGPSLFEVLDSIETQSRDPFAPFRMPIMDRYRDMGTVLMGKSEAGVVKKGDSLMVMPNRVPVKVITVYRDEAEVNAARPGENLRLRVQGVEEEDVSSGFVLSSRFNPVPVVTYFDAQIVILELLEHKPILTGGYKAILHLHSVVEECEVTKLLAAVDPKTKEKKKVKFVKTGAMCIVRVAVEKSICVELFDRVPQLGRFTLRDEGRTIAIGKVLKVPKKGASASE